MRIFLLTLLGAAILAGASVQARAASLVIEAAHVDLGPRVVLSSIEHRFRLRNEGNAEVRILRWRSVGEVGQVVGLPEAMAPGEAAEFRVAFEAPGTPGAFSRRFALFTDEAGVDRYRFSVSAFAHSLVEPDAVVLDLGRVALGSSVRAGIDLETREPQSLALTRVVSKPDWIDVTLTAARVEARNNDRLQPGLQGGRIRLATSLAAQPEVELGVVALGVGALQPSEYHLMFEPKGPGSRFSKALELRHPSGRLAQALQVELGEGWSHESGDCESPAPDCRRLVMSRAADIVGRASGEFRFTMPGEPVLVIPYGLIGLAEGQSVKRLNIDEGASTPTPADLSGVLRTISEGGAAAAPASGAADADAAAPPPKLASGAGPGPARLVWRARNAERTYGFIVYRSLERGGPFVRVSEPIRAGRDGEFEFVDADVDAGETYYYYVDAIGMNGRKERFSPTLSKTITAD